MKEEKKKRVSLGITAADFNGKHATICTFFKILFFAHRNSAVNLKKCVGRIKVFKKKFGYI